MRSPIHLAAALAALQLGCVHSIPAPMVKPGAPPDSLTGTVWWHRPADGDRCLDWTFVPKGEGHVHLEHREIEEAPDEGWSREVRTFYSIAEEFGSTIMYAPGYEYRWIRMPVNSHPGEHGAMGYVTGFCVTADDGRRIEWVEAECGATSGASVKRWYRAEVDCLRSLSSSSP